MSTEIVHSYDALNVGQRLSLIDQVALNTHKAESEPNQTHTGNSPVLLSTRQRGARSGAPYTPSRSAALLREHFGDHARPDMHSRRRTIRRAAKSVRAANGSWRVRLRLATNEIQIYRCSGRRRGAGKYSRLVVREVQRAKAHAVTQQN